MRTTNGDLCTLYSLFVCCCLYFWQLQINFTSQTVVKIFLSKMLLGLFFFFVLNISIISNCRLCCEWLRIFSSTFLALIHYLYIPIAVLFRECDLSLVNIDTGGQQLNCDLMKEFTNISDLVGSM